MQGEIGEVIKSEKDFTCEIRFPNKIAWFSVKDIEGVSEEEHRAEFEAAVKAGDYKPKVEEDKEPPYNPDNIPCDINYWHYKH